MGKPSGLAALDWDGSALRLVSLTRLAEQSDILAWVEEQVGSGDAMAAVDAPLVIPNATGTRKAERLLNQRFRAFDAGCHPANQGRPFFEFVTRFSSALGERGFQHGAAIHRQQSGRWQIEVHPHAASVNLFDLDLILKYKKGVRAQRATNLERLRALLLDRLPRLDPPLLLDALPELPAEGELKPAEDQLDAVLCAYIGAHYWFWGKERNAVFGKNDEGYIVVPEKPREDYTRDELKEQTALADPIAQFEIWLNEARTAGIKEPTAMALATVDPEGQPSARMVLLKGVDARGFTFFTNYESRKGHELSETPKAALVFYWAELERQVRITGPVSRTAPEESDQYFRSRPLGSRLGAIASRQSSPIADRAALERDLAEVAERYRETEPPRPEYWGGYRVEPLEIEFWQGRSNRLHDRLVYKRSAEGWVRERLSP
jgi:pyridoxamine 5'-phosphate oxidase